MLVFGRKFEMVFKQTGAPGGIHQPVTAQGLFNGRGANHQLFVIGGASFSAHIQLQNIGLIDQGDTQRLQLGGEVVFDIAAINLIGRNTKGLAGTQLVLPGKIIGRFAKKYTDAEFFEVFVFQVLQQTQVMRQVMGAYFDRGFPHLGDGARARKTLLFHYHNR